MLKKIFFIFLPIIFLLTACSETSTFQAGDKKDDFCGVHLSFYYCKCAFHGDYCDNINMSRKEAKNYVNEQYDSWVETEREKFSQECQEQEGVMKGDKCKYCDEGEISENNKCVLIDYENYDDGEIDEENNDLAEEKTEGECKYDSDCDPICEENVMWKMGCNARNNTCEKTFDTDCSSDVEIFGELDFPKICSVGACVRDEDSIASIKTELEAEKKIWSDTVKDINKVRDDINVAMLDSNKNCINGIADMTNLAIVEFAIRVSSVLAGGIPDAAGMAETAAEHASGLLQQSVNNLAGSAVDYVGDALNKLYNYQNGEPQEAEKKLKPHEYIKLNCDLYEYFKGVQAESDNDLQIAIDNAKEVDAMLQVLP
jgi:hypothetical protein